jgi:hypothetical protein
VQWADLNAMVVPELGSACLDLLSTSQEHEHVSSKGIAAKLGRFRVKTPLHCICDHRSWLRVDQVRIAEGCFVHRVRLHGMAATLYMSYSSCISNRSHIGITTTGVKILENIIVLA